MTNLKIFAILAIGFITGIIFTLNFITIDSVEKDGVVYKHYETQFSDDYATSLFVREGLILNK